MSRVIKFRGWCTRSKCMYSPEEMGIDQLTILPDGRGFINVHGSSTALSHILDYIIPEQFTGLTDREGTEIYEGDIVKLIYWWFDGNQAESELTGAVVYIPKFACYGLEGIKNAEWIKHIGGTEEECDTAPLACWNFLQEDLQIIGNIHENPELLK